MDLIKVIVRKVNTNPLIVLILISLSLRLGMAIYLGDTLDGPEQERIYDQHSYDLLARSLLIGQGYSFEQSYYPFTPAHMPTAHWSFLYPLFLSGIYAITGFHPLAARLIQVGISGILLPILLYKLGRWFAGETVGLVTAGLGMIYSYFILYDAALMTESFFLLGVLIMFILALKIMGLWNTTTSKVREPIEENQAGIIYDHGHKSELGLWVLLGIDLGITALLRQTILLWTPFLLIFIILSLRASHRGTFQTDTRHQFDIKKVLLGTCVSLIIISLFILPFTIRNYIVYGAFLPLNSNVGYALYSSNHPGQGIHFDQDYAAPLPEEFIAQQLNEAQLNTQLTRRGLDFIISDPVRYFLLSLNRVGIFFSFGFLSDSSFINNIIRTVSTGAYLPLYLLGIWFARRNSRRLWLFYSFAVIFSSIHILSWASIRYRMPIDAVFMPFAALAVVTLIRQIPARWVPAIIRSKAKTSTPPEFINKIH